MLRCMDFGRLNNQDAALLDTLDLRLPADAPCTRALFARLAADRETNASVDASPGLADRRVYVACPVWNHPGFSGLIYPIDARPPDYLRHYARHFNSIELNTTYYGVRPELLRRWRSMVPSHFKFVPKISKVISHDRALVDAEEDTLRFCNEITELGETLGPLFLLLPGGFGPDRGAILARYVERFPRGLKLMIELRHPGWFATDAGEKIFSVFEEHNVGAIITDVAGRRDVLHQRLTSTAGDVLIRFVGNRLHASDYTRLDAWVDRLADWFERGLRTVYFILHQPDESFNVQLATYFIERLNRRCRLALEPPRPLARQQELF